MEAQNSNKERKRGRPAGRDRVPLTKEERRARNAQYERERRSEFARAIADLAQAAGYDRSISTEALLKQVVTSLENRPAENNLEQLRKINTNLESQIETAEYRLANEPHVSLPTPPQSPPKDDEDGYGCMRTRPYVKPGNKKQDLKETEPAVWEGQSTENSETPVCEHGLILGLFTEAEAKHDVVQHYIALLKEEGFEGPPNTF